MGEFDSLTQSPEKRRSSGGRRAAPPPAGKTGQAPLETDPGVQQGHTDTKETLYVRSEAELSTQAVLRELEEQGINMERLGTALDGSLTDAEKQAMLNRQEDRDAVTTAQEDYKARIKSLTDALGKEYRRDLVVQPPAWAAQDLQPGYGPNTRQERALDAIMQTEFARLVRVLDKAGYTITKAKQPQEADEK